MTVEISRYHFRQIVFKLDLNFQGQTYGILHRLLSFRDALRKLNKTFISKLIYSRHISSIAAYPFCHIHHNHYSYIISLLRVTFIAVLRSILDYSSSVMRSRTLKLILGLEHAQRYFAGRKPFLQHLSY